MSWDLMTFINLYNDKTQEFWEIHGNSSINGDLMGIHGGNNIYNGELTEM